MSVDTVKEYFARFGMENRVQELALSSATVELAAKALGCEPCRIAKTLSFLVNEQPVLVVAAGDARIDNHAYKMFFKKKAKMIPAEKLEELIGHPAGGVCPFALKEGVKVYFDKSLRRFETVFPACGSENSAIELTIEQLEEYGKPDGWVDICKGWQQDTNEDSLLQ
jgi:prolyl-tRNA editing enzyme YbaK/EbsC (Cys-tRNA(Pro) deacylase)